MRAAPPALRAGHPEQRHPATIDWRQRQVRALIAERSERAWQRRSAGAGAHGQRFYDWARVELLAGFDPGWARWALARRTIPKSAQEPAELAYYVCAGPIETTLEQLVAVAGGRWRIEECFQATKNEAAWPPTKCATTPPGTATSPWPCSPTPISQPPAPPRERGSAAGNGQLIALTVPELRRLLNTLIRVPRPDLDHAADWSWWRRRRQAQARAAHYCARGHTPP